jgi:glycosyltransferase involved in cell wall biosynthesis
MKKKILQIVDVQGWAIDRLASAVVKHNTQFEWRRIFLHPRDLESGKIDLKPVIEAIEWCDAVDAQYWRVLSLLFDLVPLIRSKPIALTHHNEENLLSRDWKNVAIHIAKTKYSEGRLQEAGYKDIRYIPNSFDPEVFKWNQEWPPAEPAVGYVGRIVDWKGLKEIARACKELGVKLYAMGKGNDMGYYDSIPEADRDNIDWSFFEYPDDRIAEFYQNITCYVCNSSPHREVGPLPLIEAMASGVPVISTPCGIARDIGKPRENMMIVPFGEYEVLKDSIREILESATTGNELRQAGWRTIKNFSDGVMARAYSDVFYDLLSGSLKPWVSVIIPATYDRVDQVKEILKSLEAQTYPNIEALVVWDGENSSESKMGLQASFPLRELNISESGYNLAQARNLGVTEACGEVIVLCDSRFTPTPTGIAEFVKKLDDYRPEDKVWIFGDKVVKGLPAGKKTFVENWSCISRKHLIDAGMFQERISEYGGMSQELRGRFMSQGFELVYCPEAKANEILKSGSKNLERRQSMIRMKELLFKLGFN